MARLALYRHVTLRGGMKSVKALRLILRTPALLNCLRFFEVFYVDSIARYKAAEVARLTIDVVMKATSLDSFTASGRLFQTREQQVAFIQSTRERSTPLTYLQIGSGCLFDRWTDLSIPRLHYIYWQGAHGESLYSQNSCLVTALMQIL